LVAIGNEQKKNIRQKRLLKDTKSPLIKTTPERYNLYQISVKFNSQSS